LVADQPAHDQLGQHGPASEAAAGAELADSEVQDHAGELEPDIWRNPEPQHRSILAIGFEPNDPLFSRPELKDQAQALTRQGRVLFDEADQGRKFGPVGEWVSARPHRLKPEVDGKRPPCALAGLVGLGPSFVPTAT